IAFFPANGDKLPCPGSPKTSNSNQKEPFCPIVGFKLDDGSAIRQPSPLINSFSSNHGTPYSPPVSSSGTIASFSSPGSLISSRFKRPNAKIIPPSPAFISLAPLPSNQPSFTSPEKGLKSHLSKSPAGTTSVCPQ